MKIILTIFAFLFLIFVFTFCDNVSKKVKQVTEKTKEKARIELEKQAKKVVNTLFPPFDCDTPDTENNKNRFKDFLGVSLTPDIKNIYCYDDAIGIDSYYLFSFNCDSSTSNKIIKAHDLTIDSLNKDNGFGIQRDFEWWDKKRIEDLKKYSWTNGDRYFKYYWYDDKNGKAYYFEFDL